MFMPQKVSFSRNASGTFRIEFDDAVYAQADVVFVDPSSNHLTGLLGQIHFSIGTVSADMARSLMRESTVILTAPHPQGHEVSLLTPVQTLH